MRSLLIVAHPDDETLFFGGLLASRAGQVDVVCVTDGNGDGRGAERKLEFESACRELGVREFQQLDFFDDPHNRLDVERLMKALRPFKLKNYDEVFTHGPIGEYGHQHHQDVCFAVHNLFCKSARVFSAAYNCYPDFTIALSEAQYQKKCALLWNVYRKEVERFLNFLPATFSEGYVAHATAEVEALYDFLSARKAFNESAVVRYRWALPFLKNGHLERGVENFLTNYLKAE